MLGLQDWSSGEPREGSRGRQPASSTSPSPAAEAMEPRVRVMHKGKNLSCKQKSHQRLPPKRQPEQLVPPRSPGSICAAGPACSRGGAAPRVSRRGGAAGPRCRSSCWASATMRPGSSRHRCRARPGRDTKAAPGPAAAAHRPWAPAPGSRSVLVTAFQTWQPSRQSSSAADLLISAPRAPRAAWARHSRSRAAGRRASLHGAVAPRARPAARLAGAPQPAAPSSAPRAGLPPTAAAALPES